VLIRHKVHLVNLSDLLETHDVRLSAARRGLHNETKRFVLFVAGCNHAGSQRDALHGLYIPFIGIIL
jgi:hypothetical protein